MEDERLVPPERPRLGRPPGAPNKVTAAGRAEAKKLCLYILRSPEYRANLTLRAQRGLLPPAVEVMLWAYAFGKPVERVEVNAGSAYSAELADMTESELAERAELVATILREKQKADELAQQVADATPEPMPFIPTIRQTVQ